MSPSARDKEFQPGPEIPPQRAALDAAPPGGVPAPPIMAGGPSGVLALQQAAGNRAVSELLLARRPPVQPRGAPAVELPFHLERTGSGRPLDEPVRERLERAVAADLSDVRVHEDGQAERASAHALTAGNDVHFARGQYNPGTSAGFDLVAHEIAHVAQQRAGRTPASAGGHLFSDPGLEAEADAVATRARNAGSTETHALNPGPNAAAQVATAPAVQPAGPIAFLGLSAEAWGVAANVASVVGAVAGGAAGTYTAVKPGDNRVASMMLPQGFMSNQDQQKLQQIAHFEIINLYVQRYLEAHPDVAAELRKPAAAPVVDLGGLPATPDAPQPTPTPAAAPAADESKKPTGAPSGTGIDDAVMNAVKTSVERKLAEELENNTQTIERELMWGEDNTRANGGIGASGAAEAFGVTGFLRYLNIQGSSLLRKLHLSPDAKRAVRSVPGEDTNVVVRKFMGGSVGGECRWSSMDNLAVNVEGGAAQTTVAQGGAPRLIVRTHWYWSRWGPDSETWMQNEIVVGDSGHCTITASYEGTP